MLVIMASLAGTSHSPSIGGFATLQGARVLRRGSGRGRGGPCDRLPTRVVIAAPMGASGVTTLAGNFPDWTVVTYVGARTVYIHASSGGAVNELSWRSSNATGCATNSFASACARSTPSTAGTRTS